MAKRRIKKEDREKLKVLLEYTCNKAFKSKKLANLVYRIAWIYIWECPDIKTKDLVALTALTTKDIDTGYQELLDDIPNKKDLDSEEFIEFITEAVRSQFIK